METVSAMFYRALFLAAFVAFTSAQRSTYTLPSCTTIKAELQTKFKSLDPYTFPDISDFTYSRDNTSLLFNFNNVEFRGFSNIGCQYVGDVGGQVALLTLNGSELIFDLKVPDIQGRINGSTVQKVLRIPAELKVSNYSLALRFNYDPNPNDKLDLCIINGSLDITPYAESIKTRFISYKEVEHELNNHTQELVEAVKGYIPRFANGLTAKLNEALCKQIEGSLAHRQRQPTPSPVSLLSPFHRFLRSSNPQ